jgi:hypothetical protein
MEYRDLAARARTPAPHLRPLRLDDSFVEAKNFETELLKLMKELKGLSPFYGTSA